jgi:uncharacterized protein YbjT (DUF2867 family)
MSPSFLIVGGTGNTGRGVVEILSKTLPNHPKFSGYRLLLQTRSASSSAAKELAKLPHVELVEVNWPEITSEWLRERNVARVFIASHLRPNQFSEESTFLLAALHAEVEYVVRISTTTTNVRPDCPAYYPRTHWAIETMLEQPAFSKLNWTSLQPTGFAPMILYPAAELIKRVRAGEKQNTLRILLNEAPSAIIDPYDISRMAAALLIQEDISKHRKAKYTLTGPEDINGEGIVAMVEKYIGTKVEDVSYKDVSVLDEVFAVPGESKNVLGSANLGPLTTWAGLLSTSTMSKEVLELAPPTVAPADTLKALLQ